jgi:FkbM family methyltransferase
MYYSQSGEDKYLNENIFKNKKNGIYLELGALDGKLYSNTKFFEDNLNWSGILIEPHPYKFKQLKINRNNENNEFYNELISNEKNELEYKFFINDFSAVSGITNTLPNAHFTTYFDKYKNILPQETKIIKPTTLSNIINNSKFNKIDFLSLDVEGHEYEVLLSYDFKKKIDVILIEMLSNNNIKNNMCRQILKQQNYKFYKIFKHNEIYINKDSEYIKYI